MQKELQAGLQRVKDFLSRLRGKKPTTTIQIQPPQHKVIVVPPEEICETPKPLQLFQARDHHIAHNLAHQLGYVILFHERDRHDMHFRSWVFWALTQDSSVRLLKCFRDLREASEFTVQERIIINDLVNKRLIQKLSEGDKTYYFKLNPDIANMIARQLNRLQEQSQPPFQK